MAGVCVQVKFGSDELDIYRDAVEFEVIDKELYVSDEEGDVIAIYAAGAWMRAFMDEE